MTHDETNTKPGDAEQSAGEGLDETACSAGGCASELLCADLGRCAKERFFSEYSETKFKTAIAGPDDTITMSRQLATRLFLAHDVLRDLQKSQRIIPRQNYD